MTGGGSGGHITPLLVVAAELKELNPSVRIIYIGQKGDPFADIPAKDKNINKVYKVKAGKFRRYHGKGLKQYLNIKEVSKNIRDAFNIFRGLYQSYYLIRQIKPDVVFSRGGYVSVPVCLGARLNKVPYLTHDSDPVPSLTNKIIGPGAKYNLVSQALDVYPYPKEKIVVTGIPISKSYKAVTTDLKTKYRHNVNIPSKDKLIFIIGGGQGAQSLNQVLIDVLPNLLAEYTDLRVVHAAGAANQEKVIREYQKNLTKEQLSRVEVLAYTDKVYEYSGASDIVITRAGATNLAEFACQGVACIIVPSSFLVGGHQLKNAKIIEDSGAAIVVSDTKS